MTIYTSKGATISEDGVYRYSLYRTWAHGPTVVFIGANPSTADGMDDDPTIGRVVSFARNWGYGTAVMLNLFAFRSTDPKGLMTAADPIGPDGDLALQTCRTVDHVVAAWGAIKTPGNRVAEVLRLLYGVPMHCLGKTKDGHPRHPLFVRGDTKLVPYP